MKLARVCVYCGSATGRGQAYVECAREFGRLLAARGVELVFGGGGIGLMGVLADAVLAGGGRVHGVIPRSLVERELAHASLTTLHVVETMHQRKARMAELADAFLALPGGIGTLDELFEIWTWTQLGFHSRPLGLLNAQGYFDPLLAFLDHAVAEGFLAPAHRGLLRVGAGPGELLDALEAAARETGEHGLPGPLP